MSDNFVLQKIVKSIVTFYYNKMHFHENILKNQENVSINITEHKNCLEYVKISKNINSNFIY